MKRIIYQAFTRLWGRGFLSGWDDATLEYLKSLGVDYVWYTGIPRHASGKDFVKGNPGSPYSVSDWMDVNPYFAEDPDRRMEEFDALVQRTHSAGMKVLMDYIPNHVARDYSGDIAHFDYCDADWTDTLKNDWSDPRTVEAMLEILRFWVARGVDGFRCDMVELVPAESLGRVLSTIKAENPGLVFVAEVYGRDNYRRYVEEVGFDLLYDKSGLYDTLVGVCAGRASARALTWNWQRLADLQPKMLNFLENHDELRLASPAFLGSAARGYAALAFSLLFNNASFMLYFGQEAGEDAAESDNGRTSIFNWSRPAAIGRLYDHIHQGKELDGMGRAVLGRYRELLSYAKLPAFSSGRCWDLCYCNAASETFDCDRHFAFLRYDDSSRWLVVCNFSPEPSSLVIEIPEEMQALGLPSRAEAYVPAWDAAVLRLD